MSVVVPHRRRRVPAAAWMRASPITDRCDKMQARSECHIDRLLAIFRPAVPRLPARGAPESPRRAGAGLLRAGGACAHPPGHLTCCRHRRGASALGRVPVFGAQGRVLRQTPASTALDSHLAEYANHACGRRVARQRWVDCGVDSATPARRPRQTAARLSQHSHAELRHGPDAGSFGR